MKIFLCKHFFKFLHLYKVFFFTCKLFFVVHIMFANNLSCISKPGKQFFCPEYPLERERGGGGGGGRKRDEDFKELCSILFLLTRKTLFHFENISLCKTTRTET